MSVFENQKFTLLICDMFYNDNMTQKEIAAELNISRAQVCRAIAFAKAQGWVRVQLHYPDPEERAYERRIRELYGLTEVFVYDAGDEDDALSLERLAEKARDLMNIYVRDNSRVGVMAGRSVRALAQALPLSRDRGLEFVPLCGGSAANGYDWFANSNAQLFAQKTGGKYYILNAPSCMSTADLKRALEREDGIRQIVHMWSTCSITIVGIGTVSVDSSSGLAVNLKEAEIAELRAQKAVASVCCSYLTEAGKEICSEITGRMIGASVEQLRRNMTIAIALGSEKVPAIHAALMSDCVDVLITSLATARRLVEA